MAEQRLTGKTTPVGSSATVATRQGSRLQVDWTARSRAALEFPDQVASEPYPVWPLLIIALGFLATIAWNGLLGWTVFRLLASI
jgi:hypothetical protein